MNDKARLWSLSGAFGGMLYAINMTLGAGLTYATGNPGFSGLITGFTTSFVLYMLMSTTKKFGAISIAFTLYCLLAIPTVLMGPPGVYKVIVGLICGLTFDSILYIFRYKFYSFLLGFLGYVLVMLAGTYLAYSSLNLPQLEKFKSFMFVLAAIFIIEGWIAAFLSKIAFDKRIKKLSVVKKVSLTSLED
ncbi:MAG: hypothetical protein WCI11_11280 [Candidatus Methylumidiphilus sp.]